MTEDQELKGVQTMFTDEGVMAWMEEHQMELRQSVSGQHFLYWSLGDRICGRSGSSCRWICSPIVAAEWTSWTLG